MRGVTQAKEPELLFGYSDREDQGSGLGADCDIVSPRPFVVCHLYSKDY